MPSVTITLIDTPTGGVAIKTDFAPAVGQRCSAAQAAALDIINRTRHAYGLQEPARGHVTLQRAEEEIVYSSDARQ